VHNSSTKHIPKILKIIAFIAMVFFTFIFAIYIGELLFGAKSFEAYNELKHKKALLKSEIARLHSENARLQKDYFELKSLQPEFNQ
jgi:uncharacterized protein YlxW (UPF0749 family)